MDDINVLNALKEHLAVMARGADRTALKLAIREIERLQPSKQSVIESKCPHHWVGGGSDKFSSVHCTKCGEAHPSNFSQSPKT